MFILSTNQHKHNMNNNTTAVAIPYSFEQFEQGYKDYKATERMAKAVVKSLLARKKAVKTSELFKIHGDDVASLALHGLINSAKRGIIELIFDEQEQSTLVKFNTTTIIQQFHESVSKTV